MSGTIVALGGGGFSMEPELALLDDHILGLARRSHPRVCFLPTAGGDDPGSVVRFYSAFPTSRCEPSHLSLFQRSVTDLRAFVLGQDVVYVGGGNTANLLAVWRVHGLDAVLREAWEAGVVLCGVSAGALCWFNGGVTDSFGSGLAPLSDGVGLLPGSMCPHYDGEALRRPRYRELVGSGVLPPGLAADDGVGLVFSGTRFSEAVSSRPAARAYRVARDLTTGAAVEVALPTRYLGD